MRKTLGVGADPLWMAKVKNTPNDNINLQSSVAVTGTAAAAAAAAAASAVAVQTSRGSRCCGVLQTSAVVGTFDDNDGVMSQRRRRRGFGRLGSDRAAVPGQSDGGQYGKAAVDSPRRRRTGRSLTDSTPEQRSTDERVEDAGNEQAG
jgi:hypothetical protein